MSMHTRTTTQRRRSPLSSRTNASIRPLAWLRLHPGAMTPPSQQAVDAISNTPDFPRY